MTVLDPSVAASPAHDTPTTNEVVAHSISELHDLLTGPRAAGEPLHVRLEGPAAAELFGEAMAVRAVATVVAEEVAA